MENLHPIKEAESSRAEGDIGESRSFQSLGDFKLGLRFLYLNSCGTTLSP